MKNLTSHAINLVIDNNVVTIPSDVSEEAGIKPARVSVQSVVVGHKLVQGTQVPVSNSVYGQVEGLGEPSDYPDGVIVSGLVLSRLGSEWQNIAFAPDTAKAVRDDKGQIVGVPGFITV